MSVNVVNENLQCPFSVYETKQCSKQFVQFNYPKICLRTSIFFFVQFMEKSHQNSDINFTALFFSNIFNQNNQGQCGFIHGNVFFVNYAI